MPSYSKIISYRDPKSPISEVFRTLRTNIRFASFDTPLKTIVFTSAGPNEGKSTVAANLAVTLCHTGNRVLVVEGDLRNPTVHKMFTLPNNAGLTNILVSRDDYRGFVQHSMLDRLDVITSGPTPPNPAELLGSEKMKHLLAEFSKDYDYVLIDAPPVVVVTDAALLASICDGTILVLGSGEVIIDGAIKAKELLSGAKANIIGTVLNKCKDTKLGGYYYHYYYGATSQKRK
jgi:capsular exopolysaccharide synthesis family protein